MDETKRKRVVCPVTGKDGKTHWLRMGSAFLNKDNSINLYLDCLPVNGRLQVRDWDDPPWEKKESDRNPRLALAPQDEMPF